MPPVTIITARTGWAGLGLGELWTHRELLYFLVWRDLKVRYKQTFFGAAWAVLQPVLLMVVFTVSVGRIPGVGADRIPYPVFVLAGLVPWTLFSQGLTGAANSLVGGEAIITKVYFPRLLMPVAAVTSFVIDLAVSVVVLAVMVVAFGVPATPTMLWLPVMTLLTIMSALGLGTFFAAVNVRYRDVKYVVPFMVQLLMFASPVVYSTTLIPEQWRLVYALNPMAGAIEGFRWAIVGGPPPVQDLAVSTLTGLLILAGSLLYFRRVERGFTDVI